MQLLRFSKKKIFIWDFETCHLNLLPLKTHKLKNLPWSLGYLILEGKRVIDKGVKYLWWDDLPIGDVAAMMTGFNAAHYKKHAICPKEVLSFLDSYLYDKEIQSCGHNVFGFDIYIHNILRRELGFDTDWSFLERLHDTNLLAKAYLKQLTLDIKTKQDYFIWNQRLLTLRQKGLKSGLASITKELDIEYDKDKHHDALYDVDLTGQVLNQLKFKLDVPCLVD